VNTAVSTAKSVLGIGSPSRVFMEIGAETGEGFRIGIERMLADIEEAGRELAGAVVPRETPGLAPAVAAAPLTVTVHIGTVVASDRGAVERAGEDVAYAIAQALRRRGIV
ncbi:MAG: hypothetical protein NZ761_08615, partial [Dehalococcoidia bacterium]|nr:hypothetical protein [Dehalococcoidia bacterium]